MDFTPSDLTVFSSPYHGTPFQLPITFNNPNVLEIEHFDIGSQGAAFNELSGTEPDEGCQRNPDAGGGPVSMFVNNNVAGPDKPCMVRHTSVGEWLQYTIEAPVSGTYRLDVWAGKGWPGNGGKFQVTIAPANDPNNPFYTEEKSTLWSNPWGPVKTTLTAEPTLQAGEVYKVRLTFTNGGDNDNAGNFDRMEFTRLPEPGPYGGAPFKLPTINQGRTTLQMEDFDIGAEGVAFNDETPWAEGTGHNSNCVRHNETESNPVRIDHYSSTGCYVSWTTTGEWLEYTIYVPENGDYYLSVLSAHGEVDANAQPKPSFRIRIDGADMSGVIEVPNNPWRHWDFRESEIIPLSLTQGEYTLRFEVVDIAGFGDGQHAGNFDRMEFTRLSTPYDGTPFNLPTVADGRTTLQMEHFNIGYEGFAFNDESTAGGSTGHHSSCLRGDEPASDPVKIDYSNSVGCYVSWTVPGDWMEYTINAPEDGTYYLSVISAHGSVGSNQSPPTFRIRIDGVDRSGVVEAHNIEWYWGFGESEIIPLNLTQGEYRLRFEVLSATDGHAGNFDRMEFTRLSTPYGGTPFNLPSAVGNTGTLQMEEFNIGYEGFAFNDGSTAGGSTGHDSNCLRGDEPASDPVRIDYSGTDCYVSWTIPGDWMEYTIYAPQDGTYYLSVFSAHGSVSSNESPPTFRVKVNQIDVSGIVEASNNGDNVWDFVGSNDIVLNLTQGEHRLRVEIESTTDGHAGNFDRMEFTRTN